MVSPIASKEAVLADITRSLGGAPEELLFFNRTADGVTALMSEISQVLNCNFEFVSVENQARFAALQGRKIDIIFCNYQGNLDFANELAQKNWISTDPYFSFDGACYLVKK